jgi:hypothetical protein
MKFQTIKAAMVATLGAAQGTNFQTIGYQRKNKSAEDINQKKMVQVYYSSGDFPLSGGTQKGPKSHDISFNIDMTVAVSAEADLTVLNNPASTPAERASALAGVLTASEKADNELDELIEIVYQILMDARNMWLGLAKGYFASRYITRVQKDQTLEEGKFAVKTAQMIYTCNADEDVPGDTGTPVTNPEYDTTVDINDDDVEKTGGIVQNTGGQ